MAEKRQHTDPVSPVVRRRARELRKEQTPLEMILWRRLRDRRLADFKFRRQHPIGRFIVDFYCAECQLVVEIDGDSHAERAEYDRERTTWLEARGYTVIRFANRDVLNNADSVLNAIVDRCRSLNRTPRRGDSLTPSPSP